MCLVRSISIARENGWMDGCRNGGIPKADLGDNIKTGEYHGIAEEVIKNSKGWDVDKEREKEVKGQIDGVNGNRTTSAPEKRNTTSFPSGHQLFIQQTEPAQDYLCLYMLMNLPALVSILESTTGCFAQDRVGYGSNRFSPGQSVACLFTSTKG